MMFETVCKNCYAINRELVPLVKSDSLLIAICHNCGSDLLTFFGEDHPFAKFVKEARNND